MVLDIINKRVRVRVDEVGFTFKLSANGIIVERHYVQFAQIQLAGPNIRRLVVQGLLSEHLDHVDLVNAFVCLEVKLGEPLDRLLVVCG